MNNTTMQVSRQTKERLGRMSSMKGETYDQILNRLLDQCENKKKEQQQRRMKGTSTR